jgi:hypothetical protein|tara:strand:+ start:4736 stop:4903 length:168 start_codon:yes stop_codon:yes gene_type:complete
LLSTTLNNQEFLYKGYDVAVFPDNGEEITPMVGYLPGKNRDAHFFISFKVSVSNY